MIVQNTNNRITLDIIFEIFTIIFICYSLKYRLKYHRSSCNILLKYKNEIVFEWLKWFFTLYRSLICRLTTRFFVHLLSFRFFFRIFRLNFRSHHRRGVISSADVDTCILFIIMFMIFCFFFNHRNV